MGCHNVILKGLNVDAHMYLQRLLGSELRRHHDSPAREMRVRQRAFSVLAFSCIADAPTDSVQHHPPKPAEPPPECRHHTRTWVTS